MNDLHHRVLVDAIRDRKRLRFHYNGRPRLIEPQCYGIGTKGTRLLRGHQLRGGSQLEPLFDVDRIDGTILLDDAFDQPGPHYQRDDSAMVKVFAQL